MIVQDILDRVKRTFGDESGVQVTNADLIRWINDGQKDIVSSNDVLEMRSVANTVAGQQQYGLPLSYFTLLGVWVNGYLVERISMQQAEEIIPKVGSPASSLNGQPSVYWEFADAINFYPIPDTSSTGAISVYYIRKPVDVTSTTDTIDLPDQYLNTLIQYVLQQAYELDEDWTASTNKFNQYNANLQGLKEDGTWQGRRTYPTITVLPDDDSLYNPW